YDFRSHRSEPATPTTSDLVETTLAMFYLIPALSIPPSPRTYYHHYLTSITLGVLRHSGKACISRFGRIHE
ncbi:hypothetical protein HYDPIDRAFT_120294, partial [Hydnomerulius pinastri MD-312]